MGSKVDVKSLKVGDFLWWRADRMFKGWDCPCEVIAIPDFSEEYPKITLLSFDDFKETTISSNGEAMGDEISKSDATAVATYLMKRRTSLQAHNLELERDILQNKLSIKRLSGIIDEMVGEVV